MQTCTLKIIYLETVERKTLMARQQAAIAKSNRPKTINALVVNIDYRRTKGTMYSARVVSLMTKDFIELFVSERQPIRIGINLL